MSETDSFIQEVTEEVRQDQMFALWKKWGPLVIGGVVVIVGAAAAWSWMQAQEKARAETLGGQFIATEQSDPEALVTLAETVEGPAALIAQMRAAAALASDGQIPEAITRYRGIAGQSGLTAEYRDLALLQALRLQALDDDAGAVLQDLEPIAAGDGPYVLLARELKAALLLKSGQTQDARTLLGQILADPAATDMLRLRVGEMLNLSGGPLDDPA